MNKIKDIGIITSFMKCGKINAIYKCKGEVTDLDSDLYFYSELIQINSDAFNLYR